MKKLTTEIFISKSKKIHKNFYDYSLIFYKNQNTKVDIICPKHGLIKQRPDHHLKGHGCKFCANSNDSNEKTRKKNLNNFIKKSKLKWGDKFDYSKVKYKNAITKVDIICPKHGVFKQIPDAHLKHNCLKCSIEENAYNQRSNTKDFINKATKIHGSKYDYSNVSYKGNRIKIEIICKEHGAWISTPYNHIQGRGCKHCFKISKGEIKIQEILTSKKILFTKEKTFKNCKNPNTGGSLRFDFYLPSTNSCIEYDGRQHFEPIEFWGGKKGLIDNRKRDVIKNEYCKKNNIKLLRISYKENIEIKINDFLNSL